MTTVTKSFRFDAAHVLSEHAGLCRNLHGHTYRVDVSVRGEGEMVIDFKKLKWIAEETILGRLDHAFIYNSASPVEAEIAGVVERLGMRTVKLEVRSTVENLSKYIFDFLEPSVPGLFSVRVWETADNSAEYTKEGR